MEKLRSDLRAPELDADDGQTSFAEVGTEPPQSGRLRLPLPAWLLRRVAKPFDRTESPSLRILLRRPAGDTAIARWTAASGERRSLRQSAVLWLTLSIAGWLLIAAAILGASYAAIF